MEPLHHFMSNLLSSSEVQEQIRRAKEHPIKNKRKKKEMKQKTTKSLEETLSILSMVSDMLEEEDEDIISTLTTPSGISKALPVPTRTTLPLTTESSTTSEDDDIVSLPSLEDCCSLDGDRQEEEDDDEEDDDDSDDNVHHLSFVDIEVDNAKTPLCTRSYHSTRTVEFYDDKPCISPVSVMHGPSKDSLSGKLQRVAKGNHGGSVDTRAYHKRSTYPSIRHGTTSNRTSRWDTSTTACPSGIGGHPRRHSDPSTTPVVGSMVPTPAPTSSTTIHHKNKQDCSPILPKHYTSVAVNIKAVPPPQAGTTTKPTTRDDLNVGDSLVELIQRLSVRAALSVTNSETTLGTMSVMELLQ